MQTGRDITNYRFRDKLAPYVGAGRPGVIVATDAERAGQQAANRAFWQLAARGDNPRHLIMAAAMDPAELLQVSGATSLREALTGAGNLADTVIAARTAPYAERLHTVEGPRVFTARRAAEVIAALPPDAWAAHLTRIVPRSGVSPDIAVNELLAARQAWVKDERDEPRKHVAKLLPEPMLRAPTNENRPRENVNQPARAVGR